MEERNGGGSFCQIVTPSIFPQTSSTSFSVLGTSFSLFFGECKEGFIVEDLPVDPFGFETETVASIDK